MRRIALIAAACLMALAAAPAEAGAESVKVLILEKGFKNTPRQGETLELLDSLRGDLLVGYSSYRGKIEVWRGKHGLYLVNELPLEDYVEGVVKAETGTDWALEALKAQAVIVRTYVVRSKLMGADNKFHVTSTVLHQLYKGLNSDPLISKAVAQTTDEILTFKGSPIMAFYHSTGGGMTELPEEVFGKSYPYLKSVPASGKLSPMSVWARRIPLKEIARATGVSNLRDVRVASRTATGRAKELTLTGNPSESSVKATDLRRKLGWRRLPSTNFTLTVRDGDVLFEGSGWGHGVGLGQWTALEMAREGKSYREILSHFYPGARLQPYENIRL